jgi:hypothetical protein
MSTLAAEQLPLDILPETNETDPAPIDGQDCPACGIATAFLLSLPFWAVAGSFIWWVIR